MSSWPGRCGGKRHRAWFQTRNSVNSQKLLVTIEILQGVVETLWHWTLADNATKIVRMKSFILLRISRRRWNYWTKSENFFYKFQSWEFTWEETWEIIYYSSSHYCWKISELEKARRRIDLLKQLQLLLKQILSSGLAHQEIDKMYEKKFTFVSLSL